jgi:hypothetical protein
MGHAQPSTVPANEYHRQTICGEHGQNTVGVKGHGGIARLGGCGPVHIDMDADPVHLLQPEWLGWQREGGAEASTIFSHPRRVIAHVAGEI